MTTELYEEVIKNYKNLYETKEGYDTKIYAGEKQNLKEFHVHSFVLKTQSEFFKNAFAIEDGVEKEDGYFILNLSYLLPKVVEILLNYIYFRSVGLTTLRSREILNLLLPLDEFKLQPLIMYIQETLINNHKGFIVNNILEIIELTYRKEFLNKLWDFCIQEICHNPDYLFESEKFCSLNPSILKTILKRDDLDITNEIIIWENLLKWACKQHPVVQQDIGKWNKNDFTIMERRLNKLIPLVRFHHISSEDFLLKIYPFEELLPSDLIDNMFAYYMVPKDKLNINIQLPRICYYSNIVKSQHLIMFANWIDKKESFHYDRVTQIPYRFDLIYRASRDGNTVASFHEKCDNKGATIVVVKVADSEHLIGGYNSFRWGSAGGYKSANSSFIFSFTNRTNLKSAKVGYCTNSGQNAIICYPHYGPAFCNGFNQYANDMNGIWIFCNSSTTYDKIDPPKDVSDEYISYNSSLVTDWFYFEVEDYEVFQVIKK